MRNTKAKILFGVLLLLIGIVVLSYPFVSNWINSRVQVLQVETYKEKTNDLTLDEKEKAWQEAVDYNNSLLGDPVRDPFLEGSGMVMQENYVKVLSNTESMAVIEIPKIRVELPIYHGTSDEVLKKGVGHIEGTALPIGSLGAHSVLTGHTGLPTAELFTNLTNLEIGDRFYIYVLGKEFEYQVDSIDVIDPEDISSLVPVEGKDYVTLITCTPYGVNSHRLLVRGERVYSISKEITIDSEDYSLYWLIIAISAFIMLAVILYRILRKRFLGSKQEKAENQLLFR